MTEKIVSVKVVDSAGNEGFFNPADLSAIGAKDGNDVILYSTTRSWTFAAKEDPSVPSGTVRLSKSVATRLDVEDGAEVACVLAPTVAEEKYEPPP